MRLRTTLLLAPVLAAVACSDAAPPTSGEARASASRAPATCRPTEVVGVITSVYPAQARGATLQRFQQARVRAQQGDVDGAWPEFVALAADAVARQRAGTLLAPRNGTTATATAGLVDQLYVCGGRDPVGDQLLPILTGGVDVAVTPVAPGTPTQLVVPSLNFGVADPEGNFFRDPALLIIERVPDDPPFVPQLYVEHPPRFKATVLPASAQANFGTTPGPGAPTILVIICPGDPHPALETLDILRIPDAYPAEPAQLLNAQHVHGYGVTCTEAGSYPAPQQVGAASFGARMFGALRRGASTAFGWLAPQSAYAVDGGIGGESFLMSSFVAVGPANPPPPPSAVVVNDVNVFDDLGMQTAGNRQFVRNLLALDAGAPRAAGTTVIFDRGRNAPCFVIANEACRDDKITAFAAEVAAAGYALVRYDAVQSYASVPANVRTIFLVNPTVPFTAADAAGLRAFAAGGGRLVVVGEHAAFYGPDGFAVENALLQALGAGMTTVAAQIDCGPNVLPASSILPHPTTAGVTSLAVACMAEVVPAPGDATTLRSVDGTRIVGGVARLGPPASVAQGQGGAVAPLLRREGRAAPAATARTTDSRGNPIAPR